MKKLINILAIVTFISMVTLASGFTLRGFDLMSISLDELVNNETAKLVRIEQDTKETYSISSLSTLIGFEIEVDKVIFETSVLNMPADLEYSFFQDQLLYVKYSLYRNKIIRSGYKELAFTSLSYLLQQKYGYPHETETNYISFTQDDLVITLTMDSRGINIIYFVTAVGDKITDLKHNEIISDTFNSSFIELKTIL